MNEWMSQSSASGTAVKRIKIKIAAFCLVSVWKNNRKENFPSMDIISLLKHFYLETLTLYDILPATFVIIIFLQKLWIYLAVIPCLVKSLN